MVARISTNCLLFSKGRPDDSIEMVPLTWTADDFYAHARARYPVLQDKAFDIMKGVARSKLGPITVLTATALRDSTPSGSFARLWIVPHEPVQHMPMDTPTVRKHTP